MPPKRSKWQHLASGVHPLRAACDGDELAALILEGAAAVAAPARREPNPETPLTSSNQLALQACSATRFFTKRAQSNESTVMVWRRAMPGVAKSPAELATKGLKS